MGSCAPLQPWRSLAVGGPSLGTCLPKPQGLGTHPAPLQMNQQGQNSDSSFCSWRSQGPSSLQPCVAASLRNSARATPRRAPPAIPPLRPRGAAPLSGPEGRCGQGRALRSLPALGPPRGPRPAGPGATHRALLPAGDTRAASPVPSGPGQMLDRLQARPANLRWVTSPTPPQGATPHRALGAHSSSSRLPRP